MVVAWSHRVLRCFVTQHCLWWWEVTKMTLGAREFSSALFLHTKEPTQNYNLESSPPASFFKYPIHTCLSKLSSSTIASRNPNSIPLHLNNNLSSCWPLTAFSLPFSFWKSALNVSNYSHLYPCHSFLLASKPMLSDYLRGRTTLL